MNTLHSNNASPVRHRRGAFLTSAARLKPLHTLHFHTAAVVEYTHSFADLTRNSQASCVRLQQQQYFFNVQHTTLRLNTAAKSAYYVNFYAMPLAPSHIYTLCSNALLEARLCCAALIKNTLPHKATANIALPHCSSSRVHTQLC